MESLFLQASELANPDVSSNFLSPIFEVLAHEGKLNLIIEALIQTLYMVSVTTVFGFVIGVPLGVVLLLGKQQTFLKLLPAPLRVATVISISIFDILINSIRSLPPIILIIAAIPITEMIVNTFIGTTAMLVPLTIAGIPFIARLAENVMREVDSDLIRAARAMGASPLQIITKVILPESLPGLLGVLTITVINLISYSAMAGLVGGGGLGSVAYDYGFTRFEPGMLFLIVIILIVLVQIVQWIGDFLVKITSKRST